MHWRWLPGHLLCRASATRRPCPERTGHGVQSLGQLRRHHPVVEAQASLLLVQPRPSAPSSAGRSRAGRRLFLGRRRPGPPGSPPGPPSASSPRRPSPRRPRPTSRAAPASPARPPPSRACPPPAAGRPPPAFSSFPFCCPFSSSWPCQRTTMMTSLASSRTQRRTMTRPFPSSSFSSSASSASSPSCACPSSWPSSRAAGSGTVWRASSPRGRGCWGSGRTG
mmetsp:Transcript_111400/g.315378  ORF Transcript_111400/g.315378 Transcript_111400/m.315378 type:complete len:223 (-) Transcript_111400:181-849(-)